MAKKFRDETTIFHDFCKTITRNRYFIYYAKNDKFANQVIINLFLTEIRYFKFDRNCAAKNNINKCAFSSGSIKSESESFVE